MIFKEVKETSKVIFLLRVLRRCYCYFERKITEIYCNSYLYRLVNYFIEIAHLAFRFSVFETVIDVIGKGNPAVLYNSKFVLGMESSYKKLQKGINYCFNTSLSGNWIRNAKKAFSFDPLKAVGIILIVAVVMNLILSVIFQRQLGMVEWAIRMMFFIVAVAGLLCNADWTTVKNSSVLIKILLR